MERLTLKDATPESRLALNKLQPLCASVMAEPTERTIKQLISTIIACPSPIITDMQLYLLYPFIQNLKCNDLRCKDELHRILVSNMKIIFTIIKVTSIEHYMRYHTALLQLVFDKDKPGMVADKPEELKLAVMEAMTALVLSLTDDIRVKLYRSQHTRVLAQAIYVSVQIAKLEKMRDLKLEAMTCVLGLTGTHPSLLDDNYQPRGRQLSVVLAEMVSGILPGIVSALQDVAVGADNQGHVVTARALNAIHRILCLVMHDRNVQKIEDVTNSDFLKIKDPKKNLGPPKIVTQPDNNNPKLRMKATEEFFTMAGQKLKIVITSVISLQLHDNSKVRLELAVLCGRMLIECARTMGPSIPYVLETLVALSYDEYPEVSAQCRDTLKIYFHDPWRDTTERTLDILVDNLYIIMATTPRIMNNIDNRRKALVLSLLRGYFSILSEDTSPPRLTAVLGCRHTVATLRAALVECARVDYVGVSLLMKTVVGDIDLEVPKTSPWCKLVHLDEPQLQDKLRQACRQLGAAACAETAVDALVEAFRAGEDRCEVVYLINAMMEGGTLNLERILDMYVDPEVWYSPLEVSAFEADGGGGGGDRSVYNPRAWHKESVPGLYEGTVETRYIDVSLQESRVVKPTKVASQCGTPREARENMVLSCLLTEGVGVIAKCMKRDFQQHLLRTLCLLLERVGSKYEMVRGAGLKALHAVTVACGHRDTTELVRHNADYFTYQVTRQLKQEWNVVSALNILTVVVRHSDVSILSCLQGFITDMLVQSCDKFHHSASSAYLQIFLTFLNRIKAWYPNMSERKLSERRDEMELVQRLAEGPSEERPKLNILGDTIEYIKNVTECDRLLQDEVTPAELAAFGEMKVEDAETQPVEEEKRAIPPHVTMALPIIKRCIHLLPSVRLQEQVLAMQALEAGVDILEQTEDELLPVCHQMWDPLVERFLDSKHPMVQLKAFQLLLAMARVAKDFIRQRTVKSVLPWLCSYLARQSEESLLKDAGAAYRLSQAYRLQGALLAGLGELAVLLRLDCAELRRLLDAAAPYLSNKQPKPLQMSAVCLFRMLLHYDQGETWHALRRLGRPPPSEPPAHAQRRLGLAPAPAPGPPRPPADKCYRANLDTILGTRRDHD